MAGVKGRSGGPRPNSGGARPGAGRKPKPKIVPPELLAVEGQSPLEFLLSVQNNVSAPAALRVRAAIAAAPYVHAKNAKGSKKEERQEAAKKVGAGRFAPAVPPREFPRACARHDRT